MLHVVLVHPEIPPNTGNIARLCAVTHTRLHLIEPLGFRMDEPLLRRAGLDYLDQAVIEVHPSWEAFAPRLVSQRFFLIETGNHPRTLWNTQFQDGDMLIFGCETKGLPPSLVQAHPDRLVRIPMMNPQARSLNLSTAAGVALYEALRQIHSSPAP
jgi:tRNA (cytidine/uridine-2'-O-)-methyltransferase